VSFCRVVAYPVIIYLNPRIGEQGARFVNLPGDRQGDGPTLRDLDFLNRITTEAAPFVAVFDGLGIDAARRQVVWSRDPNPLHSSRGAYPCKSRKSGKLKVWSAPNLFTDDANPLLDYSENWA
jgi:hypothetical protein